MKRLAPAFVLCAALAAPALAAAPTTVVPTKLFARVLPGVKAHTTVPVLLPDTFTYGSKESKLYTSGGGSKNAWDLEITGAPNCGGANACFLTSFEGKRGGKLPGKANVKLAGGDPAYYLKFSCGASCSPDSFWFTHGGMLYSWQSKDLPNAKAKFTAAANSAIAAGPR